MKKPTDKTAKRRKLALRAEAIALLTPLQLGKVGGGWTWEWPCGGASQQREMCVADI